MTLLEVLQLVGYGTGASMTLWMCALLARRRRLRPVERTLLALGIAIGLWHASNLFISLHSFLGLSSERWDIALKCIDTIAVVSITASYSFLLHSHLYLWADARTRSLTFTERVRAFLCYLPVLFLPLAIAAIWHGNYVVLLERFGHSTLPGLPAVTFLFAFSLWAIYVLCLCAFTDLLIARLSDAENEKRFLVVLACSFFAVSCLILFHGIVGVGRGGPVGQYLKTVASLGSLLPTALIGYYIYRYRYLELIIRESLIVATFSVVILIAYLVFVRSFSLWATSAFELRSGAVESLLILALALAAVPLRGWLDRRFHRMFEREASLYREVVARIADYKGQYTRLSELLDFIETRTSRSLNLRHVRIFAGHLPEESRSNDDDQSGLLARRLIEEVQEHDGASAITDERLQRLGYDLGFVLRRERQVVGLMLVSAQDDALSQDTRSVLSVLATQVAIAIDDSNILEQNVRLERKVAHGERLAALGQMAATVAHEVKNPLSAIKSIAQVMREDGAVVAEYKRDLDLIVGETDRLDRSVTQLLSFARSTPPLGANSNPALLVGAAVDLCRNDAKARSVAIESRIDTSGEIDGQGSQAVRDALTNLALNALQSTPAGGRILIEAQQVNGELVFGVEDSGPGVPHNLTEQIWEPFFTTRQRGTGLGLAIVRKRMEEAGGRALLAGSSSLGGARFELHLPVPKLHGSGQSA
jgi:signal transduction histidine kinase